MKNITSLFATAAACLVLASGCIKEIDPQTSTVTEEQAGNAPGSFDNFVTAITNSLVGSFTYGGSSNYPFDYGYPSFFLMRDVMGQDIAVEDGSWYTTWYSCGTALGPQYAYCQVPWTYYYGWIKSCNTVISMAGEEPESDKIEGAGIAYAMRAMFYMDIAQMYAQQTYTESTEAETVPWVDENTSATDAANNPRATNEVMWAHILSDLDKAETYLADYERDDKYTPDISVVYGLKARAYLVMGQWQNARDYAEKAMSGYTMLTEDEWTSQTEGFNTPNDAWMFGVTFKSTDENILDNDADSSWGSQMIIEVSGSGCGYAANYGYPMRIDYHLYQTIPDTDFRKKSFVDFELDNMTEAEALEALEAYTDDPEGVLATGWQNSATGLLGGLEVKFRPAGGEHDNQYTAFTVAVPLMRVEEMKLIEAEAAGMLNESEGISLLTAFAQTRDPNYTYGTHTESYGGTATDFQNEVWWQRRVELWGEGFATFDIKRLDKGLIRSYSNTNHTESYRWNYGDYTTNSGNVHPDWMDLCIVQTETNYNSACTNNPTPQKPSSDSSEHVW
ncbi:MAG: RagB/SusD family nutrient uptake outer membrane protein [Bacteroides sp.]|nr:RagB/SusD family nutrient uptake outer membrane protein [Bacteroides sp.]